MVHSIELLFDQHTDAELRRCWARLSDAGLPSQGRISAPTNRPHVTLAVADRIAADADDELRALTMLLPLPCVVGAPLLFGAGRLTLARLIIPSAGLLELHRTVHEQCVSHLAPGPAPHSLPGQWTPHTTLGRRLSAAEVSRACELPTLGAEISGRFVALRRWDGDARVEHLLLS